MSLRVEDRSSRARSKSRDRSRSRSDVRAPSPNPASRTSKSSKDDRGRSGRESVQAPAMPGGFGGDAAQYEIRSPTQTTPGLSSYGASNTPQYATPSGLMKQEPITMGDYTDLPPHERPGYLAQQAALQGSQQEQGQDRGFSMNTSGGFGINVGHGQQQPQYSVAPQYGYGQQGQQAQPGYATASASASFQYAQMPDKISYTAKPQIPPSQQQQPQYTATPNPQQYQQPPSQYYPASPPSQQPPSSAYPSNAHFVEIAPPGAGGGKLNAPPSPGLRPHRASTSGQRPDLMPPGVGGLGPRMDRLSVSGNRPDMHQVMGGPGGLPPGSPLLEAYHGTWQQISPMPMALRLDDDIDDLPPLSPVGSMDARGGHVGKGKGEDRRRVKVYDAEEDARNLTEAMAHREPDRDVLIDILPGLSHDQMMELRNEYKRFCKVQGKGINIAKHIKLKVTGNFGKIAYVTALGRWESEAYWANFWYQSNNSRRELLIESLMGRTNYEVRQIKDAFKDKRYSDSLTKCMDKELKADKFRMAVLLALEERRQEETDVYPVEYRMKDADTLYRAIKSREGGESAILQVVVTRSDAHLREVLRTYEMKYGENFARAALKKSNNLVGEIVAHILNGVINRPARDCLLLRHAVQDLASKNKDIELRYELLISRLVRMHWDKLHMRRVKIEYRDKYGSHLEQDIEDSTKGDFMEFCLALCET